MDSMRTTKVLHLFRPRMDSEVRALPFTFQNVENRLFGLQRHSNLM